MTDCARQNTNIYVSTLHNKILHRYGKWTGYTFFTYMEKYSRRGGGGALPVLLQTVAAFERNAPDFFFYKLA